jgi:hypothetical protein
VAEHRINLPKNAYPNFATVIECDYDSNFAKVPKSWEDITRIDKILKYSILKFSSILEF